MNDYILRMSQETNCLITIMYQKENQITKRNIKVVEISEEYIKAFCYLRNQLRIFKKDQILSALPYKKRYDRTA